MRNLSLLSAYRVVWMWDYDGGSAVIYDPLSYRGVFVARVIVTRRFLVPGVMWEVIASLMFNNI